MSVVSKTKSTPRDGRDGKDILNVLYTAWRNEYKAQCIIGCWLGGLTIATLWGIYTKRRLRHSEEHTQPAKITRKQPSSFMLKDPEISNNLSMAADNDEHKELLPSDENETPQNEDEKPKNKHSFSTFKAVLEIAIPNIVCAPILWSTLLSAGLVWKTSNVSQVNDIIGHMGELLVTKKWKLLADSTMSFAVKTAIAAASIATVDLLCNLLSLSLRDNLVHCIKDKYRFSSRTHRKPVLYFAKQEISDIDARITNDVKEWSASYSQCFISFCKPLIDVSIYSQKIVNRIGAQYYAQCIFYFFVSSMFTRSVLPSFSSMKQTLLKYESVFQSNNHRIVEFCEEIYYLNGIETEIKILDSSYYSLYHKLSVISVYDYVYDFAHNYLVRYLGILASFMALLPMVKNEKQPTEFLLNNLHDLVNIGLAMRDLFKSSRDFQSLKGISNRIMALNDALQQQLDIPLRNVHVGDGVNLFDDDTDQDYDDDEDEDVLEDEDHKDESEDLSKPAAAAAKMNKKNIDIYKDDDDDDEDGGSLKKKRRNDKLLIAFKNVCISTPDQSQVLLNEFNFNICLGENTLIVGPNGAGKSSLIRVISGLWQCDAGKVKVRSKLINDSEMYFMPSRAYLVPGLSLKAQVLYPDISNERGIADDAVTELLSDCGLGKLVDFVGADNIGESSYIDDDFWNTLSAGEKQLIALCRLLIKAEYVKLLFVDESFSNLAQDRIKWFYQKLSQHSITVVTISHNVNFVRQFHDTKLTIVGDGSGKYTIETLQ